MTPDLAQEWILVLALTTCVVLGAAAVGTPIYKLIRNIVPAATALGMMVIGIVLLTTPKWQKIALKGWGVDVNLNTLIAEIKRTNAEIISAQLKLNTALKENNETIATLVNSNDMIAKTVAKITVTTGPTDGGTLFADKASKDAIDRLWETYNNPNNAVQVRGQIENPLPQIAN